MTTSVKVPDIGDFDSVPVIEVLVAEGDTVAKEDPLIVLESDKATMEVPSTVAGVVKSIKVKADDTVSEGDVIVEIDAESDDGAASSDGEESEAASAERSDSDADAVADSEPRPEPETESATSSDDDRPKGSGSAGATKRVDVTVPDIGDYDNVPVIEVLVADGDVVEAEASLVTLESDKATMDVPAPVAGTVRDLQVAEGATLSQGDRVCRIETSESEPEASGDESSSDSGEESSERSAAASSTTAVSGQPSDRAAATEEPSRAPAPPQPSLADGELPPLASPAVRKFARELGVDLRNVDGSGRKGRIMREDVEGAVRSVMKSGGGAAASTADSALPTQPDVDFSAFGETETKPLSRIGKLSARHLARSWLLVPHVTQTDNADITDLEAFRKSTNAEGEGPKLTLLPFVIKAVAHALGRFPKFNASLAADGEHLIYKRYCHIGFAADTEHGLVVPVVRDVWSKGIAQLAQETADLAARARDGKLKSDEMKGGCFSISSLGGIGGSHFTPIVNAPEVAILGVSRASQQPVWDGSAFQPRLMCPLSLSYDHRVVDGADAARFTTELGRLLGDVRRLTL